MKWIVVAILLCIVPYTWVTLKYRKEGPAYEPYQDSKDRAQVIRLLDAGFQRVEVALHRSVDPLAPLPAETAAVTEHRPGGMPPVLSTLLIDPPLVPDTITQVVAPRQANAAEPLRIGFTVTSPNHHEALATATVYRHEFELTFAVSYDELTGELEARRLATNAWLEIPAHTLAPGSYHATLVGARDSLSWRFEVQ